MNGALNLIPKQTFPKAVFLYPNLLDAGRKVKPIMVRQAVNLRLSLFKLVASFFNR